MKRILFVCTVNVCRSPMAKAFFDQSLSSKAGSTALVVTDSAGTTTFDGYYAASGAQKVMRNYGLDLHNHRSKVLTEEMLETADIVFVMEKWHKHVIVSEYPQAESKIHLLTEYVGRTGDILDPTSGDDSVRACAEELRHLTSLVADRLSS